mmetsp:Transcript_91182/g.244147  ORF Transcript_91182/g.244147 Transcript_91182/m.244147 type:complete len:715 (+) Transcript_91182:147-2291(+)
MAPPTGGRAGAEHYHVRKPSMEKLPRVYGDQGWSVPRSVNLSATFFKAAFLRLADHGTAPVVRLLHLFKALSVAARRDLVPDDQLVCVFDVDGDGVVTWREFRTIMQDPRILSFLDMAQGVKIDLSFAERVYLTFDDPQSSKTAKVVSFLVMAVILLSSVCFVMEADPRLRDGAVIRSTRDHPDFADCDPIFIPSRDEFECEPQASPVFFLIETGCIVIFTVEYFIRLCTIPAVRTELIALDEVLDDLVEVGEQGVPRVRGAAARLVRFVRQPLSLIDLLAILPFYVQLLVGQDAGGLGVLRTVRLTRVFRIFKLGKFSEVIQMFGRTMKKSLPALYVLLFEIGIGIVVFSALIYFCEVGTWKPAGSLLVHPSGETTKTRDAGYWRLNLRGSEWERSPFYSIPASMWWVVVTTTTVGFGDVVPTTAVGQIFATIAMLTGLIMLAMPIGVIGANFMAELEMEHEAKQAHQLDREEVEQQHFTGAVADFARAFTRTTTTQEGKAQAPEADRFPHLGEKGRRLVIVLDEETESASGANGRHRARWTEEDWNPTEPRVASLFQDEFWDIVAGTGPSGSGSLQQAFHESSLASARQTLGSFKASLQGLLRAGKLRALDVEKLQIEASALAEAFAAPRGESAALETFVAATAAVIRSADQRGSLDPPSATALRRSALAVASGFSYGVRAEMEEDHDEPRGSGPSEQLPRLVLTPSEAYTR